MTGRKNKKISYGRPRCCEPLHGALFLRHLAGLGVVILRLVATLAVVHFSHRAPVELAAEHAAGLQSFATHRRTLRIFF